MNAIADPEKLKPTKVEALEVLDPRVVDISGATIVVVKDDKPYRLATEWLLTGVASVARIQPFAAALAGSLDKIDAAPGAAQTAIANANLTNQDRQAVAADRIAIADTVTAVDDFRTDLAGRTISATGLAQGGGTFSDDNIQIEVQKATNADILAGTNATKAIAPDGVAYILGAAVRSFRIVDKVTAATLFIPDWATAVFTYAYSVSLHPTKGAGEYRPSSAADVIGKEAELWFTTNGGTKYWLLRVDFLTPGHVGSSVPVALNAAITLDVVLLVEEQDLLMTSRISLMRSGRLRVRGNGVIVCGPGVSGSYALQISGYYVTGGYTITYPVGNGSSFGTETPSAKITADVQVGDRIITVDSTAGMVPGQILRAKQQRLFLLGDHRNATMYGEQWILKEVISGTQIELQKGVEFGYKVGLVTSGTATGAGTSSTFPLPMGLDPNLVAGCRLRFTGGLGAGRTSYIVDYNATTGTATIGTTGGYAQAALPATNNTTTYEVDAESHITIINPLVVEWEGVKIDAAGRSVYNCLDTAGINHPVMIGIKTAGGTKGAINLRNCIDAYIERPITTDCGADDGHSILSFECVNTHIVHPFSERTRRGGGDSGGTIPDIRRLIEIGNITVYPENALGVPYDQNTPSFGIGAHGMSYLEKFSGGTISGAVYPFIARGYKPTFENIDIDGDFLAVLYALDGQGAKMVNVNTKGIPHRQILPAPSTPRYGERRLARVGVGYAAKGGGITVESCDILDLTTDGILFDVGTGYTFDHVRVLRNKFRFLTATSAALLKLCTSGASSNFLDKCEIYDNDVEVVGGGFVADFANWGSSDGTNTSTVKVGNKTWIVSLPDQKAVFIRNPVRQTAVDIKIVSEVATDARTFNGRITVGTATVLLNYSTAASVTLSATTPLTGTTGASSTLSASHDANGFYLENRTGSGRTYRVTLG